MVLEAENNMGMLNGAKHWLQLNSSTSGGCKRLLGAAQSELCKLNPKLRAFVEDKIRLCQPDQVQVCDGSEREYQQLVRLMQSQGSLVPLPKLNNCYLARTDPADVARVESKTFIATKNKKDTVPEPKPGVKGTLGNWMSIDEMDRELESRFPGCMKGRTMYVIPFSMGPIGSPLAKLGLQLTDSAYVAASMRVMTRMGAAALQSLNNNKSEFVKCLHSVGQPLPMKRPPVNSWPCDPERTIIAHIPDRNEIASFGSGYGGNSLLGKKCFALRIGSILGKRQGWLAEHMLILSITNPKGEKKYLVAAFPSACGKTNLAMMEPTLPGYTVRCVGDDIAWMKFDKNGQLRAINPEAGFFGVAPGTSNKTNPNAMKTIQSNTIFTNVGQTEDGGVFWEGMESEVDVTKTSITTWLNEKYDPSNGKPAAHPNSRFCTPASQCPIIDEEWQNPEGVPISGIIFGGRRPEGIPLVYEAFDWAHGVLVGASMRSESTAAAEHKGKQLMHDPFAMRPFFGYNFGDYLQHWLNFAKPSHPTNNPRGNNKLPKIFHVNWFRKDQQSGQFLWPGFGENCRVLDWICRRIDNEPCADRTAIGLIPARNSIRFDGLEQSPNESKLFEVNKSFWQQEVKAIEKYFDEQTPNDLPIELREQLEALKLRLNQIPDQ